MHRGNQISPVQFAGLAIASRTANSPRLARASAGHGPVTYTRPVPPALLAFYFEESGFGRLETRRFAPAEDSIAAVKDLPESVRQTFFGSMDYAVLGLRL